VATEQDHGVDVVATADVRRGRFEFAVYLAGERVGRRSRQQQRRDARVLLAGVDGYELVHASGASLV
jgi:hypothetical protein